MREEKRGSIRERKNLKDLICFFFPIIVVIVCWLQLEVSCGNIIHIFQMSWHYVILNIATIILILFLIELIINNRLLSCIICEIIFFLVAVINYYVIIFHGLPFSINELKNFTTALNVLQSYKFAVSIHVVLIVTGLIVIIGAFALSLFLFGKDLVARKKSKKKCILVLGMMCLLWGAYFSKYSVKPQKTIGWSWEEAYYKYGYLACSIESIDSFFNSISRPEGYADEYINKIEIDKKSETNSTPDIILIINESFFDLRLIADIDTDIDYMNNIRSLDNAIKGYAVCSAIGGGTNNSEYEILTSNSLQLMPGITPFNVLDMANSNSLVSHLNGLGYDTLVAHSEPAVNYMRGQAYPAMGFEKIYFKDSYGERNCYGERLSETDRSEYAKIINWYDEMDEDTPRFVYLLTMQNHGPWNTNPEEYNIVHIQNDMGDKEAEVNEYLSCIHLSNLAFEELIEYFENVEREVIICMVGDHAPTFASEIIDEKYTEDEKKLLLRSTPFVIWSNYGLETRDEAIISMNYLIPTVLDAAGVKLSPYYQYLLELKQEIPILTSFDKYYDKEGNIYSYEDENRYSDMINQYFYMEYNNLQKNRRQELFDPYQ